MNRRSFLAALPAIPAVALARPAGEARAALGLDALSLDVRQTAWLNAIPAEPVARVFSVPATPNAIHWRAVPGRFEPGMGVMYETGASGAVTRVLAPVGFANVQQVALAWRRGEVIPPDVLGDAKSESPEFLKGLDLDDRWVVAPHG